MPAPQNYLSPAETPSRAEGDALPGLTLLECGTDWCGPRKRLTYLPR